MPEVFNYLRKNKYGLLPGDFFLERNSIFFPFLHTLVMCNLGIGRSLIVAEDLCVSYQIPSIYVVGGLNLVENQTPKDQELLINIFNTFPVAVAILGPAEERMYKSTLDQLLRLQVYSNLNLAVRKIVQSY